MRGYYIVMIIVFVFLWSTALKTKKEKMVADQQANEVVFQLAEVEHAK